MLTRWAWLSGMSKPEFADTGHDDVITAMVKGDVGPGLC